MTFSGRTFKSVLGIFVLAMAACTKTQEPVTALDSGASLATRGRRIYQANCTACHNQDPSQDGAVGPSVAGSSLELIERRVVHGDYPPGYNPKRSSHLMVALAHLKEEIPALHAYLQEKQK